MTKAPTRQRAPRLPSDQRIAKILLVARQLIRTNGYEALSMAEIARQAGVVEGTLYRYFDTKRALLERVALDWFSEQLSDDTALPGIVGTWNRLRHLIWRGLQVTRNEPVLSRFLLTELRPTTGYRDSPFFELNRRFTGEIRTLCQEAIASGEFHDDVSPSLLRNMIFGCIEHQTWAYMRGEGDFDVERTADSMTTVIFRGMIVATPPQSDLSAAISRLDALTTRIEAKIGN